MSQLTQKILLRSPRFMPLFWTQFLTAFNDNVYKNALVILVIFQGDTLYGIDTNQLVIFSAGLFILPFFLFSATAGQLADKYEKSALIQKIKLLEIVIMSFAIVGFYTNNILFLIILLFLMGSQSALFGPLKYAILPQHLKSHELIGGNGLMSMGVFLAILLGTIAGGIFISFEDYGEYWVSALVIIIALIGFIASLYIPNAPPPTPELKINWNIFAQIMRVTQFLFRQRDVFIAVIAVSWFWFIGSTFFYQIPALAKYILGSNNEVVTLLLFMFSFGIGIGSMLCEKLSKGEIELGLVPFGAIGLIVFSVELYLTSQVFVNLGLPRGEMGVLAFLAIGESWRVMIDLMLIGLFGGFYIVPLNATVQHRSERQIRAQIISGANINNAFFMVMSSVSVILLLRFNFSIPQIFLLQGISNFLVMAVLFALMPEFLQRFRVWIRLMPKNKQ